jgi:small subunit ribosomal protein S19e
MSDNEQEKQVGTTVKDVAAASFVKAYAQHLKRQGKLEVPKWVDYVKTSTAKELAPYDPDWFYIRCASIARKIYLRPNAGVGALTKVYGSNHRRGAKSEHFKEASSGLIRYMVRQLEAVKVLEKSANGKGRKISKIGQQDLDRIAAHVRNQSS